MRLLIVSPGSGWILDHIAESIAGAGGWSWMQTDCGSTTALFNVGTKWPLKSSPRDAEAVFFWDVQNCWGDGWREFAPNAVHVGAFTHLDRNAVDERAFRPGWDKLDGIVHMAKRYEEVFAKQGWYPRERMTVIMPGQVYGFPLRPLRLGVCQRGGFLGKGDPFLFEALAGLPAGIRQHVELRIKGSGWRPAVVEWMPALSPLKVILDETEKHIDYSGFYREIDYLLVPSLWEGGPMCVQEALASGVPVIAADVGFVPELLTIEWDSGSRVRVPRCVLFPAGNADALASSVRSLVEDRLDARRQVEGLTWKSYAEKLEDFVETLRALRS